MTDRPVPPWPARGTRSSSPVPPGRPSALTTTLGIARRTVLRSVRTPQVFVLGMVQGAMFLLIFRYVFGGAIPTGGIRYVDFLVPGFVGTGVLFSGMTASIGAAEDLQEGLFDRLRSLPVPRLAIVSGRVVADTALAAIGLASRPPSASRWGSARRRPSSACWRIRPVRAWPPSPSPGCSCGWASWPAPPRPPRAWACSCSRSRSCRAPSCPVESMPGWMQGFAENQPLTQIVNATRAFTLGDKAEAVLGHPASYFAIRSLLWCLLFIVIFAPLAARKYQKG